LIFEHPLQILASGLSTEQSLSLFRIRGQGLELGHELGLVLNQLVGDLYFELVKLGPIKVSVVALMTNPNRMNEIQIDWTKRVNPIRKFQNLISRLLYLDCISIRQKRFEWFEFLLQSMNNFEEIKDFLIGRFRYFFLLKSFKVLELSVGSSGNLLF